MRNCCATYDFPSSFCHVAEVQQDNAINWKNKMTMSSMISCIKGVAVIFNSWNSVCLPCKTCVRGGAVWITGACVLLASCHQSAGVCGPTMEVTSGPCFPLLPGEENMMSGSLFQGSTKSFVSTRLSLGLSDSGNCRDGAVTVSIGSSSWEVEDNLR